MSKSVFITGGSSGIGQAVVQILKDSDWEVLAPTHSQLDLSNLEAVKLYISKNKQVIDNLEAIIHIAGVWHDDHEVYANKALSDFSAEQITDTVNVTLTSAMLLVSKLLTKVNGGTFIAISGTFADGAKGWLPYYVSKRALEDLVVGLSQDMANCQVFGVSPSDTATPAYKKYYPEYYDEAQSTDSVATLVKDLLDKKTKYSSGDIIEVRQGIRHSGFHA